MLPVPLAAVDAAPAPLVDVVVLRTGPAARSGANHLGEPLAAAPTVPAAVPVPVPAMSAMIARVSGVECSSPVPAHAVMRIPLPLLLLTVQSHEGAVPA